MLASQAPLHLPTPTTVGLPMAFMGPFGACPLFSSGLILPWASLSHTPVGGPFMS